MRPSVGLLAITLTVLLSIIFLAPPALPAFPAPPAPSAQKTKTRLFAPEDLGLLEAPDRHEWNKPDQIMDALGIADGSAVAARWAGGRWVGLPLARRPRPH